MVTLALVGTTPRVPLPSSVPVELEVPDPGAGAAETRANASIAKQSIVLRAIVAVGM